jgi:DNA-binding MarR family transcriptional regulator
MEAQLDTYHKLIVLMIHTKQHMTLIMDHMSMTPIQGMLLLTFEPDQQKTMQELSQIMGCDASNMTGLIDRLDTHGLIERTADPKDRRVKVIALSKKGEQCREQILLLLQKTETADMQRLTADEQATFVQIVNKLRA